MAQTVKRLPAMWETQVRSLGWEDPLEKAMAPHSSTLAWKIPWMEEPHRLHSPWGRKESGMTSFSLSHAKSLQSCPTLCDPMDCSLPGSSAHGFLQTRILEWVAMPFSRASSRPRDRTHASSTSCIGGLVLYH